MLSHIDSALQAPIYDLHPTSPLWNPCPAISGLPSLLYDLCSAISRHSTSMTLSSLKSSLNPLSRGIFNQPPAQPLLRGILNHYRDTPVPSPPLQYSPTLPYSTLSTNLTWYRCLVKVVMEGLSGRSYWTGRYLVYISTTLNFPSCFPPASSTVTIPPCLPSYNFYAFPSI